MPDTAFTLHWLAIAAAAVASSALGGAWFTVLFGRAYAVALGRPHEPGASPKPLFIVGPFVCGAVTTVAMALLMVAMNVSSWSDALGLGCLVGLGFLVPTTVNTAINPNMPHPLRYGLISGGYFVLSAVLVSAVLFAFQ